MQTEMQATRLNDVVGQEAFDYIGIQYKIDRHAKQQLGLITAMPNNPLTAKHTGPLTAKPHDLFTYS